MQLCMCVRVCVCGRPSDKFVSIRGNVIRVSSVRPLVIKMNFTCAKCQEILVVGFVPSLAPVVVSAWVP